MNTLNNARENEILLQSYQSYKQDRIYRWGEFDHTFPHTFNVLWNIEQIGCRENKIFQKKRRLKIRTHAKLLSNETRNVNCNTSDQGLISHSRAIKNKQTSVYLWSLKQPSALLCELLEKMIFMMNSMANFFLAALLFMRLLCMFFELQSDFTDARRRQIHYLKKTFTLLSCHDNDVSIEEGTFENTKRFWIFS